MIPVEPDPDNAGGGRIEKKNEPFLPDTAKGFFYLTKGSASHGNNGGGDF